MSHVRTAVLLAVLTASLAHTAIEPPKEKEKWLSIRADEFSIFSNASERETVTLATNLLRMREALGKVTRLQVRSPLPTKVFIFRNEGSFAPYRDSLFGRGASNIRGLFAGGATGNFILLQADAPLGVDRGIFHELTHYFVKNTLPGLPLWFNEGIAEYYSTFSVSGSDVNVGRPIPEHVLWLRNESPIPLAQLFAIDQQSKEYHERNRQGVFYAESWALVHYLMRDAEGRDKLAQYLALVKNRRPIDEAFHVAFSSTFDAMERELRSYIRRYSFAYTRYSANDLQLPPAPVPRPMTRDDVLFQLGDLLAHSSRNNFADAESFLMQAAALNGNQAGAIADLAFIHDVSGRREEASGEYEKALQLGTRDANTYLAYGTSLLEQLQASSKPLAGNTAAEVLKVRGLFQRAAELDPGSARAYAGLGATYVISSDDPTPGISALEKSFSLAPAQEDVAFNLVQLYARAGRREDANRLTETVIARGADHELLPRAREAVVVADVRRAEGLIRAGKLQDAAAILKALPDLTTNADLKSYVASVLSEIEQRTLATQQVDALNAAVRLANSGKIGEALTAIDKLMPVIDDPNLRDHAKQFREQLIKAKKK